MNKYKIVIKNPFKNCEYIYPIQQAKVKELIEYLKSKKKCQIYYNIWIKCK